MFILPCIICILISIFIFYSVLFNCYIQIKKRESFLKAWSEYKWVTKERVRPKLWWVILACIVTIIPYINVIIGIITIIVFIYKQPDLKGSMGFNVTSKRYVITSPTIEKVINFLNKRI